MWVVLSLQAASIGQIPVILCCLGLLLTPLLVTCDGPGRLTSYIIGNSTNPGPEWKRRPIDALGVVWKF